MTRSRKVTVATLLALATGIPACGFDDALLLDVTSESAAAGTTSTYSTYTSPASAGSTSTLGSTTGTPASAGTTQAAAGSTFSSSTGGTAEASTTSTGPPVPSGVRASPFCNFAWGRRWDARLLDSDPHGSRGTTQSSNVDFLSAWLGFEDDNRLGGDALRMVIALKESSAYRGKMPVFYAPIIAFKAKQDGLDPCDPESTRASLCTDGADWIRNHRDYLRDVYDSYIADIALQWGTSRPMIWLFEPGFSDYTSSSQSAPLSLDDLSIVARDLIPRIRSGLPTALISHHFSPTIEDFSAYFNALNPTLVHLVNVTGAANSERFGSAMQPANQLATYRNLHNTTGLPILVDTGFAESAIERHGWLTSDASVINARISDGVFAVNIEPPPSDLQKRIEDLRPYLTEVSCAE